MLNNDDFNCAAECDRCLRCPKPSCVSMCPVGNRIPEFLQLLKAGDYSRAVQLIGHPFGEVCGYVCPHERQCQGGCVLGRRGESVRIAEAEKTLFERYPYPVQRVADALKNKRIAVVGGGVAGVTCAVKLYEQCADVTVFERDELLSTLKLIPEFRLPHGALARIERQLAGKIGIVRQSVNLAEVYRSGQFDLVYIATGAAICRTLGVLGEEFATPYPQFLAKNVDMSHKNVIVIGGGNTAMDCARWAKRLGANVTVAYRRTRADMPAFDKEISSAENEGVELVFNVAPVEIVKQEDGLSVDLAQTESEGRGKLTIGKVVQTVVCDQVVAALGSKFDKSVFDGYDIGNDVMHPLANVYVGGDAAGGNTVAEAVADAMCTAKQIIERYKNGR